MKKFFELLEKSPLVILFATVIVIAGAFNVKNQNFFDFSLYNCLYLFVVLFISYYLTQIQNDVRKRKEVQISVIESILKSISRAYEIRLETTADDDDYRNDLLTFKRELSNKINLICDEENGFNLLTTDIDFLQEKVDEYGEIIGNHISDIDYLKKSTREMHRPLSLLEQRLYKIMLTVYK